jgi:hypothetical protein
MMNVGGAFQASVPKPTMISTSFPVWKLLSINWDHFDTLDVVSVPSFFENGLYSGSQEAKLHHLSFESYSYPWIAHDIEAMGFICSPGNKTTETFPMSEHTAAAILGEQSTILPGRRCLRDVESEPIFGCVCCASM